MIDRAGQLWEHSDIRYYVLYHVPSLYNESKVAWCSLCLSDPGLPHKEGTIVTLSEDFFDQEWWHRIA